MESKLSLSVSKQQEEEAWGEGCLWRPVLWDGDGAA